MSRKRGKHKELRAAAAAVPEGAWRWWPFLAAFLIAAAALVVYKDFLLLDKLYLFKDIASDSINYSYPQYVHIAQYFRTEGLPGWSFNQGMGQNIFPGCLPDPFTALLVLAGGGLAGYGMAFVEVLKIFCAGLLFYLFLRKTGIAGFAATVGALCYSFSGFMVLGGGWGIFSTEAVYAALLLYAFERLYQDGGFALLPLSVALIAALQPFDLYLYGLFLCVYMVLRFLDNNEWNARKFSKLFLQVLGLGLLGAAISSFFLVNGLLEMYNSPRVAGEASFFSRLLSKPLFGLESRQHNGTAILRFFSSDLLGTGTAFMGWNNYLEAPLFYCGLLTLLVFPQVFFTLDKRRKVLYGALLGLCLLPVVFPYFRYAYWLFAGDYYRNFSFFVALVLLLLGVKALDGLDKGVKPGLLTLALTLGGLLGLLYFPYAPRLKVINEPVREAVTFFLAGYGVLLACLAANRFKPYARALLLLAVTAEAAYMADMTVNHRPVVTAAEYAGRTGYNDYTGDAVAWLKAADKSFFRVEKDYFSGSSKDPSVNDAKVQDYYGTPSYHSFNQLNYVRFLLEMGLIEGGRETLTRWAPGLRGVPPLHSFGSVKYALSRSAEPLFRRFDYELVSAAGDIKVFRNKYALPLGFTYEKRMSPAEFAKLSPAAKAAALYKAFVADEDVYVEATAFPEMKAAEMPAGFLRAEYARDVERLGRETLDITQHGQNLIRGGINLASRKLLFFSIPFDPGWSAKVDGRGVKPAMVNIGFTGLFLEKGRHEVELRYEPPYLKLSAAMSLAAMLLYCGLLFLRARQRRTTLT
ncbi:MAG: hypothetical protein COT18_08665 [Elusimicrobia bacterium CG08_land_8_20_14_0_20_59_10]|nr:MAG: hypothetical protein COT18_08665 [Elusimicrobia bacterium CG08_land_8_20_14_0_20_59_10]